MPFKPFTKEERQDFFALLAAPHHTSLSLAAAVFLFSAIMLPLSTYTSLSGLYLAAALVLYYSVTHSILSVLLLALPAFFLFALGEAIPLFPAPTVPPVVFVATVLGASCGAFLLVHCRKRKTLFFVALLPVAAYLTVLLRTGDPMRGLLVLIPTGLALLLGLCFLFGVPHTPAVLLAATALGIMTIMAGLLTLAVTGGIHGNPLLPLADGVRSALTSLLKAASDLYLSQGISLGLSDADIENAATLTVNLLPGLFLASLAVVSFVAYRLHLRFHVAFGTFKRPPARLAVMTLTPVTAGVFLASYLLSLFLGGTSVTLAGTVAENLSIVLQPALALVGFSSLLPHRSGNGGGEGAEKPRASCLSLLLAGALFLSLWLNPAMGFGIAALVGAIHILTARWHGKH